VHSGLSELKVLLGKLLVNRKDLEVCTNRSIKNTWTLPDEERLTDFRKVDKKARKLQSCNKNNNSPFLRNKYCGEYFMP
jgi:hypothetical protein